MAKKRRKAQRKVPKSTKLFRKLEGITKVTFMVDGKARTFDLREEIRLTRKSLRGSYFHHAEQFMFWRSLLTDARNRLRQAEDEQEKTRAVYELAYRKRAEEAYSRVGDWEIKCQVESSTPYLDAKEQVRERTNEVDLLTGIVAGLEQRSFMIGAATREGSENE